MFLVDESAQSEKQANVMCWQGSRLTGDDIVNWNWEREEAGRREGKAGPTGMFMYL